MLLSFEVSKTFQERPMARFVGVSQTSLDSSILWLLSKQTCPYKRYSIHLKKDYARCQNMYK
jgi:hypothetical protein